MPYLLIMDNRKIGGGFVCFHADDYDKNYFIDTNGLLYKKDRFNKTGRKTFTEKE